MKKVLLTFLAAFLCYFVNAQPTSACSVSNFTVQYKSSTASNSFGKSNVTIDIYWFQDVNNGNKFTYLSIWEQASYLKYNFKGPKAIPLSADLAQALGVLVIKNDNGKLSLFNTYGPDPSYKKILSKNSSATITKTRYDASFDLVYIKDLIIPGVNSAADNVYSLIGDVWSSQHPDGLTVQCSSQTYAIDINSFADRSILSCNNPTNKITVQIASKKPAASGSYAAYIDANDNGQIDTTDVTVAKSNFQVGSTSSLSGVYPYLYTAPTVTIPAIYRSKHLLLLITGQTNASSIATSTLNTIFNSCALLPVAFKSFTAVRNKQKVVLKWETVSEQNNKGFYIQRNMDGVWKDIALVFSQAADGNSNALLSYAYNDANAANGITQYRLLQMDFDGKARFSEVRLVPGAEQEGKILIYPNPSNTGTVNVVFDRPSVRDVIVSDVTGRIVKNYSNVTATLLVIEKLTLGFYAVKITDRTAGTSTVEKVVIK